MQVFIPINIENFHWYLAIVNAKKNEVHILDSMGPQITDRRDLYTTVSNYSLYICDYFSITLFAIFQS
jgi:Ulp1 family protease